MLGRVRQKISYALRDAGSLAGIQPSLFKQARGTRIVLYHGICQKDHTRFNNIFLTLKTFEAHLQFYKRHFNILSLDDYYEQRFSKDRFNICISFDDGYANNYKYVLPLLEQYKIPAAFFITAIRDAGYDILWNDFLGILGRYGPPALLYDRQFFQKDRFNRYQSVVDGVSLMEMLRSAGFGKKAEMMRLLSPLIPFRENRSEEDYWLQMTQEEITALSASRWATIGAHGLFHNDLARISPEEVERELTRSKRYLENLTGKEVRALAFPYGTYSKAVVEAAKKANFLRLLAVDFHFKEDCTDPAMRERLIVNPYVSVNNQLFSIIKGINTF